MKEISENRAKELLTNKGVQSASVTAVKETTPSGSHEPTGDKWPVIATFEDDEGGLVIGVPGSSRDL